MLAHCEIWYGLHWLGAASLSIKHTAGIYWCTTVRSAMIFIYIVICVQGSFLLTMHAGFFFSQHSASQLYSYTHSQLEVPQFSLNPVLLAVLLEQLRLSVLHKGSSETQYSKWLFSFIPGLIFPSGLDSLTSDLADTRLLFLFLLRGLCQQIFIIQES